MVIYVGYSINALEIVCSIYLQVGFELNTVFDNVFSILFRGCFSNWHLAPFIVVPFY